MTGQFKAILAQEEDGKAVAKMVELSDADLPEKGVLVEVAYSDLNYKDGLALNGNLGKVMRRLPMVPGIDLSGTVVEIEGPEVCHRRRDLGNRLGPQ